jgi:hypothetical protein
MKIIATPVKGKDLQPGDLFSVKGPEYWNYFEEKGAIGEKVYIRTATPSSTAPDENEMVYRITIQKESINENR